MPFIPSLATYSKIRSRCLFSFIWTASLVSVAVGFATCRLSFSSSPSIGTTTRMMNGDDSASEIPENALVITIGPPTCGKTTWLKQRSIPDIALDDQPGVYMPIKRAEYLLAARYTQSRTLLPKQRGIIQTFNRTLVHGKTLLERLTAPKEAELAAILRRLQGEISAAKLKSLLPPTDVNKLLCSVIEERIKRNNRKPVRLAPNVDLFVLESLFRGGMLERATRQLWDHHTIHSSRLAWGNTNTLPRDYQSALEMAWKQKRPVYFCVFEPVHCSESEEAQTMNSSAFDLRVDSFKTLLERSIDRLVRTGRYVPAQTILDMNERWKGTLQEIETVLRRREELDDREAGDTITAQLTEERENERNGSLRLLGKLSRLDLHRQLAGAAGYNMNHDRKIRPLAETTNRPMRSDLSSVNTKTRIDRLSASSAAGYREPTRGRGGLHTGRHLQSNGSRDPAIEKHEDFGNGDGYINSTQGKKRNNGPGRAV